MVRQRAFQAQEAASKREVQFSDMMSLQEDLKKFPQKRIGKYLVSPFHQYLVSLGSCRITEEGQIIVKDATAYTWFNNVNTDLQHYEYKQAQKHEAQTQTKNATSEEDAERSGVTIGSVDLGLEAVEAPTDGQNDEAEEPGEES